MKAVRILTCVAVFAMVAAGASAQMLDDFEAGATVFSGGAIVADPDNAGNNVLFLGAGELATLDLATPLAVGQAVSMKIYDQGLSAMDDAGAPAADSRSAGSQYGWNVGVAGTYNWGVSVVNKTFLSANSGYGWTDVYYDSWPQNGSIWSTGFFAGPRQVDALSVIGTGTIADPEIAGDGAWSTWTWTFNEDGSLTVANDAIGEKTSEAVESAITQIYLNGSRSGGALGGVWVDDVQIIDNSAPAYIPGDANGDGVVNIDDFVALKNGFGTGTTWAEGDFDGNGAVNIDDFVILKNNFGASAVPEPATMSLLALGGLAVIRRRK